MEHYLIIARSVTYAQRMQRALARSGIRCRIFRAPRDLTDRGCAYAVQIADRRPVRGPAGPSRGGLWTPFKYSCPSGEPFGRCAR